MAKPSLLVREAILHMFFVEQWSIPEIAEELCLAETAVRRVIVIDGGARRRPPRRPHPEESES
jgi:hypothetical protein